jgi:AraC-like DNA-binding protein
VLALLGGDDGAERLASAPAAQPQQAGDRGRMDRVLDHLHRHYMEPVGIDALADIAALSASGLHRMFKRHARMSVTRYLAQLRIGEACAMLSGGEWPVAHIAAEVGYETLANFNRQFRAFKGMTPRGYRNRVRVG